MKIRILLLASFALSLGVTVAHAGVKPQVKFFMPSSIDPDQLTITQYQVFYANDNLGHPITGNTLVTGGLQIIGKVPQGNFYSPIRMLKFFTTYTDPIGVSSLVGQGLFTPWAYRDSFTTINNQQEQVLTFYQTHTSADLDYGAYSALMTALSTNQNFLGSTIGVVGYNYTPTPEASSILGFALLLSGCSLLGWRRKRQSAKV